MKKQKKTTNSTLTLVVNALVKRLDEHIADTGLANGRVTLGPHNAARLALDRRVVERVESALG